MFQLKKFLAVAIIFTFLASVAPLLLPQDDGLIQLTYTIEADENYVKPPSDGGGKPSVDYKIIYRGFTSQVPLNWVVYTKNPDGLTSTVVSDAITAALDEWQTATTKKLANPITIAESDATGIVAKNEEDAIMFGDYPQSGVIAVTYIWINRVTKQIVECDIVFDVDFTWGDGAANPALMDLQNIAAHELGHTLNLDDIYDKAKADLTMYGYSDNGDIEKRSLAPGDIAGIQAIYGP